MHILLSTFPLSFFFFDFSRGKISIFKREWKRGKPFFSHNFWMPKNRFVSIMLTTDFSKCCPRFHSLFFFLHFSARKISIFKREWKRGKHFQSQFWFIQKLVCEHYAHNWFFHCCEKYFGNFKIGQEKNVQFRKNENSFSKKMHFFICERHAKKIFH